MNHPAWTLSHLNVYHPVIAAVLRGQPFEDSANHKFGMKSKPSPDRSLYPSKRELLETYTRGHELVASTLKASTRPCWKARRRWSAGAPRCPRSASGSIT